MLRHDRPKPIPQPRKWPHDQPKPALPMVHLPIFRVHYKALESYLARVYRMQDYDFLMASGCVPGMVPQYEVRADLPPAWDCQADKIRSGQRSRNVPLILTCLCKDGFIPAGTYIIDTKPLPRPIEVYRSLLERTRDPQAAECGKFRKAHEGDLEFKKHAAVLDNTVLQWQRSQKPT